MDKKIGNHHMMELPIPIGIFNYMLFYSIIQQIVILYLE